MSANLLRAQFLVLYLFRFFCNGISNLLVLFKPYYEYYTIDTDTHEVCRKIWQADGGDGGGRAESLLGSLLEEGEVGIFF